jgi:hypothetical protein
VSVFIPGGVSVRLRPLVEKLLSDVEAFSKLHRVQDKDSKQLIPFDPLPMQTKIFDAVRSGARRIVVVKARQVAATTACKMVLHHMATTTPNAAMFAVVSMRDDSATALLDDFRRWLDDVPRDLKRPILTRARGRIVYGDTRAEIRAFTSRSQTGLRSFSPRAVLISEAAYAPDLEEVVAQADAAVGDGLLIVESTANNPADFFSRLVQATPDNGWSLLTHWWYEHPTYRDQAPDFEPTKEERELATAYGLDREQLAWYRRVRGRLNSDHKFRREYPSCLDDCFLDREGGYYGEEVLSDVHVVEHTLHGEAHGREIEPPHASDRYVVGVDVGGGVGGDYHALAVVSVATRQPVYVERNNRITPAAWAHRVIQVASRYNRAIVLAESNNHGHLLIHELDQCGYRQQWRNPTNGRPWITTLQSKLEAFDTLREALPLIRILDRPTWLELRSLTIPAGKIAPEAPKGGHDDSAIALALAYRCLRDVPSSWRTTSLQSNRTRIDDLIASARARRIRSHTLPF